MLKSGIIVLNKPTNISSNAAVTKVKKILNAKKVGHLGTLDPLACGVLPICVGKATRLFDYFLKKTKTYSAIFVFGFETTTLDSEGEITKVVDRKIEKQEIESVLQHFRGKISQVPPMFSAIKVGGKKAYDVARGGGELQLKAREIEIFELSVQDLLDNEKQNAINFFKENNKNYKNFDLNFENVYKFKITCSSGTYIRSLCRDIAAAVNSVSTMIYLQRTQAGAFKIDDSIGIDEIDESKLKNMDSFIDLPRVDISIEDENKLLCGQKVCLKTDYENFKLFCNDVLYGIASAKNGMIKVDTFLKED